MQRGECSIRAAMEMANLKYGATGVGSVSYGTVFNYSKDEEREPLHIGRPTILPAEFTDKLVSWIRAKRALKFPVFRDEVLAMANFMVEGTGYATKFKHASVDVHFFSAPTPTTAEDDDDDGDAELMTGRISSANLYSLGPVTSDRAYHVVSSRDQLKKAALEEAGQKKADREKSKDDKHNELRLGVTCTPAEVGR